MLEPEMEVFVILLLKKHEKLLNDHVFACAA
jgi:hypothetical protein